MRIKSSALSLVMAFVSGCTGTIDVTPNEPKFTNYAYPEKGGVYTRHYNLQRTGANSNESILNVNNVAPGSFAKRASFTTDAYSYTQPLYVPGVKINGETHNVVYVGTAKDSLFAFDADAKTTDPLWKTNFTYDDKNTFSLTSLDIQCPDQGPDRGILGTPVIDPNTGMLYVVSATKTTDPTSAKKWIYHQHIHMIDISTGKDFVPPTEIVASPETPGFDPLRSNQRPGLVLSHGIVYAGFSSNCDIGPYNGMLIAFDAKSLQQIGQVAAAKIPNPNTLGANKAGGQAGIWMSGMAPAVDRAGNLFLSTGNGNWDGNLNARTQYEGNFADSVLKISPATGNFKIVDFFTPFDFQPTNNAYIDLDLGSGGVTIIPANPADPRDLNQLVVAAGKTGQVYLINPNGPQGMGQFNTAIYGTNAASNGPNSPNPATDPSFLPYIDGESFSNIFQSWNLNSNPPSPLTPAYAIDGYTNGNPNDSLYGTPAYYNSKLYYGPVGDTVKAYQQITKGPLAGTFQTYNGYVMPVDQTKISNPTTALMIPKVFGFPGVTPTISANGPKDPHPILWIVDVGRANNTTPNPMQATLYAYDANALSAGPLFNSDWTGDAKDIAGPANKYASPTVINGNVYFMTKTRLEMYGLTGNAKTAGGSPSPTTKPTNSGAMLFLNFNQTYQNGLPAGQGCTALTVDPTTGKSSVTPFVPAASYQYVVQPCGSNGVACESTTALSGGIDSSLSMVVSIPVGSKQPIQVDLAPGTYELLPGTNAVPYNGGFDPSVGAALIYAMPSFTFTVPSSGYVNFTGNFFCGLANLAGETPGGGNNPGFGFVN